MTIKILISITILSLILPIISAVPVTGSQIIDSNVNITNNPTKINIDKYESLYYNETTPKTVREFLKNVPPCPWFKEGSTNMCSMNTRYLVIQSHYHGINLNEITISHRTGVCGGHRVPTFKYEDKTYYCTNLYSGDTRVVDSQKLRGIVKDLMNIDNYGLKNYKKFPDDWFERNGY